MAPIVNQQGTLTLSYDHGHCPADTSANATSIIFIRCPADGKTVSIPTLNEPHEQCHFTFFWEHPIACAPAPSTTSPPPANPVTVDDCKFKDAQGITFDLTQLANEDVEAIIPANDNEYQYSLRVCGVLATKCNGELASGCQHKPGVSTSIGSFTTAPYFSDGDLVLTYVDGSSCDTGSRSTHIRFICDTGVATGKPEYIGETSTCVYEFEWRSVHACGQGLKPTQPLQCVVEHDGELYDFNLLRKVADASPANWLAINADAEAEKANYDFYISICEPLHSFKGIAGCAGAGICQIGHEQGFAPRAVGQANHEPEVTGHDENGLATIVMRYTLPDDFNSTDCPSGLKRNAVINFFCQEGQLGAPNYIGESKTCLYEFNWYTSAACPEEKQESGNCTIVSDKTGQLYDLRALKVNVLSASAGNDPFELAVCEASSKFHCAPGDGACTKGSNSVSWGKINQNLILEDEQVSLIYEGGSACSQGSTTTLKFECDRLAQTPTAEYVSKDACNVVFRVRTNLVCPAVVDQECVVVDSEGHQHDLSILKRYPGDPNWRAKDDKATPAKYFINVCHSLVPTDSVRGCGNAAACQIDSNGVAHPLGNPSAPYFNSDGKIQLSYTGGEKCSNGKPRSVDIIFTCQDDVTSPQPLGQPEFDSEKACSYTMYWTSVAACRVQDRIEQSCHVLDPVTRHEYDLTGLEGTSLPHKEMTYHISACKPLTCNKDTNANGCQTTSDGTYSLGASGGIELYADQLSLNLNGGDPCHSGTYARSAKVSLVCVEDGKDELTFTFEDQASCTYFFEWRTQKACPINTASQQCLVNYNERDLDLAPLMTAVQHKPTSPKGHDEIIFNVCATVANDACDDSAAVCKLEGNGPALMLGSLVSQQLTADADGVHLKYTQGDTCPSNRNVRMTTTIDFVCSHEAHTQPALTSAADACDVTIRWPTCRVCMEDNPCHDPAPGTDPDESSDKSSGSSHQSKGGVVVAVVIILVLIVMGGAYFLIKPERRASFLGGCSKPTNAPKFKYSKLDEDGDYESSVALTTTTSNLFDDSSDDDDDDDDGDDDDEIIAIE
eukprot:TRINITY_DN8777_c0_g1_i2.p1 TRINITY_DN8777_c0_g1~~TRINITY_DN8777_c0_g1_i2.p1  ORF type:complete len:1236 (+),score=285.93 TRINITY_DN8777_c0_g1_i2:513-3710(+)